MDSHREALEQDSEILQEREYLNQTIPTLPSPSLPNKHPMASLIIFAKGLILFLLLLTVFLTVARVTRSRENSPPPSPSPSSATKVRMSMLVPQPFPKILWVLCGEGGPGGLPMVESVGAQHQISVGKASGYDVRVVDLINAYDWLSAGTVELIRQAKHNTQYYIPVGELLRVALLLEHGGVSAKLDSIIFTQRLDWIESAFNYDPDTLHRLQQQSVLRHCSSEGPPEILLFSESSRTTKWFQTALIIARADSRLLGELFSQMVRVLRHSRRAYDAFQNFGWYNNDRTMTMEGFLPNLISFRSRYWNSANQFCRDYRVLEVNRKEGSFMQTLYVWPRIAGLLLRDREAVFEDYGRSKVMNVDLKAVRDQLMEAAKFQSLGDAHPNSLFREIVKAEGNEWLLRPISHIRDPNLCIVSLKPLPFGSHQQPIHRSLAAFEKDNFKQWQAIFFVEGLNEAVVEFSTHPAVTVVNASEWEGLNLQRAATKHCHPHSIVLLLDYDESFPREDALTLIADQFSDRRVFAAFLGTKIGERTTEANPDRIFRTKLVQERLDNIRQIAVNLRAFSVSSYRLIGQFDLHDVWGRYFNRQIPLNTLLQMQNTANDRCEETEMKFHVKRAESQGKELPRTRVYMPEVVVLMANERTIDESLPEYAGKHDAHEWCEALEEYYERIKGPLEGFFVLNNGSEFQGLQHRRHLPPLIPSKIHQVWIGNVTLPAFKQQLMDHFKAAYPTWEHRLWTNADITRDNFPLTYDLIQTLFQFDRRSPSDKMAMISDIMRLEVLYRHGGFYFDTNYYIFKGEVLEDWRSFEEVFVGQLVPFYKFQRENSLMACVPGSARFLRLLDHRRLSARNFFSRWANLESGPAYVSFALQGDQEMAPTVFQPAYEWVYPWYYGSNVPNACQAPLETPDEQLLFRKRHAYWKNCSQLYSGAFGIQFFLEGGSWMVDRE